MNALVFSKLFYCSNVWSNTTERNLDKVQAVQNFACRIISESSGHHDIQMYDLLCTKLPDQPIYDARRRLEAIH
jgi:hypothetical protein